MRKGLRFASRIGLEQNLLGKQPTPIVPISRPCHGMQVVSRLRSQGTFLVEPPRRQTGLNGGNLDTLKGHSTTGARTPTFPTATPATNDATRDAHARRQSAEPRCPSTDAPQRAGIATANGDGHAGVITVAPPPFEKRNALGDRRDQGRARSAMTYRSTWDGTSGVRQRGVSPSSPQRRAPSTNAPQRAGAAQRKMAMSATSISSFVAAAEPHCPGELPSVSRPPAASDATRDAHARR